MTKNPIINALAAALYIALVASAMFYGSKIVGNAADNTVLAPMAFISLFTLSAGVMGYVFLSEPFQFYMSGDKKTAVSLFLKTLGSFAVLTILAFVVLLFIR